MPARLVRRSSRQTRSRSTRGRRRLRPDVHPDRVRSPRRHRRPDLRARLLFVALAVALVVGGWHLSAGTHSSDRVAVIGRAETWTDAGVPYSQTRHRGGYRTDCSGFVSMAWGLPENLTTWRIPLVAEEITKNELQPGDVLLDHTSDDRHVVIFEKWANNRRTEYWGLESSGHPDVERAIRRRLPYPYLVNAEHYRPYRYIGMDAYWDEVPETDRQPVQGYDSQSMLDGS